jgi:amino acid adenylation domain-containing protein
MDSVMAADLVAWASEQFGLRVDLAQWMVHPTVAALGRSGRAAGHEPPLEPVLSPWSGQRRLWFLHHTAADPTAYHLACAFVLDRPMTARTLQGCWAKIAQREPWLTARFVLSGTELEAVPEQAPIEVTELPAFETTAALAEAFQALAQRPYTLGHAPAWRLAVAPWAPGQSAVLLACHHLLADLRTLGRLVDILSRPSCERPDLQPWGQWRAWHEAWLQGPPAQAARAHFAHVLSGARPLSWPPAASDPGPFELVVDLTEAQQQDVLLLARVGSTTPAAVHLAALHQALCEVMGARDVLLATVVDLRREPWHRHVLGFLTNTVPLRMLPAADPVVAASTALRHALLHGQLPLTDALRAGGIEELGQAISLFFSYEQPATEGEAVVVASGAGMELPGGVRPLPVRVGRGQFPLTLAIAQLPQHTRVLWSRGARGPARDLLEQCAVAHLAVIERWRRERAPPSPPDAPQTEGRDEPPLRASLLSTLAQVVQAQPEAVALRSDGAALTYRQLWALVQAYAADLERQGVGPEDRVLIEMPRSAEQVAAVVAALYVGGVACPLDIELPVARRRQLAERIGAKGRLEHPPRGLQGGEPAGAWARPVPQQAAYVLFTSGSTGLPKGAINTHAGLANRIDWMRQAYAVGPGDVVLYKTPLSFDVSLWEILLPLASGATLVVGPPGIHRDAESMVALVRAEGVSLLHLVPSFIEPFVAAWRPHGRSALRDIICSGEVLGPERARALAEVTAARVHNLYGPAECAIDVTACAVAPVPQGEIGIGRPIDGVEVHVLDTDLLPTAPGVEGELWIGGLACGRGYLDDPRATAQAFRPHPAGAGRLYRTGDIAVRDEQGRLWFRGRRDQQVKIRGVRIEPEEIEGALRRLSGVREAVVLPVVTSQGLQLAAYLLAAAPQALDVDRILAQLSRELPPAMVPTSWFEIDALARTPSGKVDRRALAKDAVGRRLSPQATAALTPSQQALADLWLEVLGNRPGSPSASFVALGGHSLHLIKVAALVRRRLNRAPPLRELWQAPTLAAMSEVVTHAGPAAVGPEAAGAPVRLTSDQQQIWLTEQLAPGSYNLACLVRGAQPISTSQLQAALVRLVARHPALRCLHALRGSEVVRWEAPVARWPRVEARHVAPGELEQVARAAAHRPFLLAEEPLLRALHLEDGGPGALLLVVHHLVCDGTSAPLLLDGLAQALDAVGQGQDSEPREPLRHALPEPDGEATQGLEPPAAGRVPTRFPIPLGRADARGEAVPLPLTVEDARALWQGAAALGQTPATLLLAAWGRTLHALTGQQEATVALAHAGPLETTVDCRVQVLRLQLAWPVEATTEQIALLTQQAVLGALRTAQPRHRPATADRRLPWPADTLLALQPLLPERLAYRDGELTVTPIEHGAEHFHLTLAPTLEPQALGGTLRYATSVFDRETATFIAQQFVRALRGLLSTPPPQAVGRLPIGTARQQQAWSHSPFPALDGAATSVDGLLLQAASRWPERRAVVWETGQLTYRQLLEEARAWAAHLQSLGAGPERVVALQGQASAPLVAAMLGTWMAGAAFALLDPSLPETLQAERLALLPAPLCVVLQPHAPPAPPLKAPMRTGRDLAYVMFTSGSTGRAKLALLEQAGIANTLRATVHNLGLGPDDRFLQHAALTFDNVVWEVGTALAAGAELHLGGCIRPFSGLQLHRLMQERAITCVVMTPSVLSALPRQPLPALRLLCVGGEACPRELALFWAQGRVLYNTYGPTEVSVHVTLHAFDPDDLAPPPIGRPIQGCRVHVLDAQGQPVSPLTEGELYLGGIGVGRGYQRAAAETAERFVPDPFSPHPAARLYRTGDRVRQRVDGTLEFLGRSDAQLKVRGHRVEASAIEGLLETLAGVRAAAVRWGPRTQCLVAYLVADEVPPRHELQQLWQGRLPEALLPDRNGKLDRNALPDPDQRLVENEASRAEASPCPSPAAREGHSPTERVLHQIWSDLVPGEPIGLDTNFFDAGGNSLLLAQLQARLLEELGQRVALVDLLQWTSIRRLAAAIEGREPDEGAPASSDRAPRRRAGARRRVRP